MAGLVLTACGSGSSSTTASTSSPSTTTTQPASATTAAVPTTAAATSGTSICPTLAPANAALGGSITTPTAGGGVVCEYTSSAGNASVTIFAHQSATVFAGQVAHAPGVPAMPSISGVGDGAFGTTTGGRTVLNAYSSTSRTFVAAQAPGALAPVEALARVALADN